MKISNNISNYLVNPLRFVKLPILSVVMASVPLTAFGEVTLENSSGWKFGVNGHIPVFALVSDNEDTDEDAFRITTGFNPATAQFNIYAPQQNGLDVSGHFQLNSHLAGADGVQNSGFGKEGSGRVSGVESRVAEIAISGDFGSVNIGKGFGIFGVPGIGDNGSGLGVGLFNPNSGDATAGRIGNGYFYANFNPRIIYTSADMSGTQFKIGLFQPEKPKDGTGLDDAVATESPRVEGNVVWSSDMLTLWSSAFIQNVDVDSTTVDNFTMFGADFGGSYTAGDISFRANYSLTQGTGNGVFGGHGVVGGAQEEDASQWYIEGTYNMNKMKLGASYGEGTDDLSDNDTDLSMLFLRYKTTEALTLMVELQAYGNDVDNNDYNALIVGSQFTF
jgi:hypothetical protein